MSEMFALAGIMARTLRGSEKKNQQKQVGRLQ
jgi:hypothetical protein